MLNETSLQEFRANLRGALINLQDQNYDQARKVYNGMTTDRLFVAFQLKDNGNDIGTESIR